MTSVSFQGIVKAYRGVPALAGIDLTIPSQSFTVLCGPPKAGKSVLFRMLMGLEQPDRGQILLDGEDITRVPAPLRQIGYVPQSFALYPHFTVYQNIAYPLTLAGRPKAEIEERVDRAAALLSMRQLLKKTPDQLSGGEKQRAAVARGLLKNASVFVLDDPLVGLDYKLRERLMDDLRSLRNELQATFVYATSDSLEALTMAQRLAVLEAGHIVQYDEAIRVYDDPQHVRALELVGFPRANAFAASVADGVATSGDLRLPLAVPAPNGPVTVGLRPEAVRPGAGNGVQVTGRVQLVEHLGGELVVYADVGGHMLTSSYPAAGHEIPAYDSTMTFNIDPSDVFLFSAEDGRRLRA